MDFSIHPFSKPQMFPSWLLSGVTITFAGAVPTSGVCEKICQPRRNLVKSTSYPMLKNKTPESARAAKLEIPDNHVSLRQKPTRM
jgi:hypothetical protein